MNESHEKDNENQIQNVEKSISKGEKASESQLNYLMDCSSVSDRKPVPIRLTKSIQWLII